MARLRTLTTQPAGAGHPLPGAQRPWVVHPRSGGRRNTPPVPSSFSIGWFCRLVMRRVCRCQGYLRGPVLSVSLPILIMRVFHRLSLTGMKKDGSIHQPQLGLL